MKPLERDRKVFYLFFILDYLTDLQPITLIYNTYLTRIWYYILYKSAGIKQKLRSDY
jgi:hypothetical protein